MEDLFFYVLDGLLEIGYLEKCATKIGGKEAFRLMVERWDGCFITSFVFFRSDIELIREAYDKRRQNLTVDERVRFDKFFALL